VDGNQSHRPREMQFGTREEFEYSECGRCGCLQIARIPEDLVRYYPESFGAFQPLPDRHPPAWERWLRRRRSLHELGKRIAFGGLARRWLGPPRARIWGSPNPLRWLRRCGADLDARILDVGCGSGSLLLALRDDGFTRLTGVDPLIPRAFEYAGDVRIHARPLADIPGPFDVVMLHHSFEHVPDPEATLREVRERTASGGWAIVRTPLVDCHAWRSYGVDWVQLDAPRHLHIHTRKSMEELARRIGLEIAFVECDSFAVQFWGSEQYRLDIPLMDPHSHLVSEQSSPFEREQIAAWEARSAELNELGDGDSACFYLRRPERF
jgi:SAM-dependent methyltransferase